MNALPSDLHGDIGETEILAMLNTLLRAARVSGWTVNFAADFDDAASRFTFSAARKNQETA